MKTSSSWVLLRQFINFTYWCILLICALAFLHQAYDIMAKFEKQSTIVSMNLYHLENNYLPAITICPFNVFKDVELYHEKGQNLENHVMNLSEILTHNFIEEKVKTGEILVHETFAPRMGRCFTLNFSKPVNGDISEIPISLRNDSNYQVYFHEAGAEMWHQLFLYPTSMPSIDISIDNLENMENIAFAFITIKHTITKNADKKSRPCQHGINLVNFTNCAFNQMPKDLPCLPVIHGIHYKFNSSRICQNPTELQETYDSVTEFFTHFLQKSEEYGCPMPCVNHDYVAEINYHHRNALMLRNSIANEPGSFFVEIGYKRFEVKVSEEFFVYDGFTMLSSMGGSLGLFLGLSCMSLADYVKAKLDSYINARMH